MPAIAGPTRPHQLCKASTQKSLVSAEPKIRLSAPLTTIKMPSGTIFCLAGGSWSHPSATLPSSPDRHFPPPHIIADPHLRLGIHGNLQGFRVAAHLLSHRLQVGEDRVGFLGLLQRLALAKSLETKVHPVEDVPHRAFAGQILFGITLGQQRLAHFIGRQRAVATGGLQFRPQPAKARYSKDTLPAGGCLET